MMLTKFTNTGHRSHCAKASAQSGIRFTDVTFVFFFLNFFITCKKTAEPIKIIKPEHNFISAENSPKIVCRKSSARTQWGSLQRCPRLPSWIKGMKERSIGEGEGRGKKGRRKGKTNINELNPDHEPGVRFYCTHKTTN